MGLQPVVSKAPGTGGLYPCLEPSFTTPGGDVNSLITIGTKDRSGHGVVGDEELGGCLCIQLSALSSSISSSSAQSVSLATHR